MTERPWIVQNIHRMLAAPHDGHGMDFVIVSTPSSHQQEYWQQRLTATRGQVCSTGATVIAVHEDWPGGAGNGLGTLYALAAAAALSRELHGIELMSALADGAAVAVYHTAGKGTRLAPLPGTENNNKPAVKLPGTVEIEGRAMPITILEAVIRQTGIYAHCRKGRVSVFWGDQVFIPDCDATYVPRHHADILAILDQMPDEHQWRQRGLDNYGLISVDGKGDAVQIDKVSHQQASVLIAQGILDPAGGIGPSLGSFSMSTELTRELLVELDTELAERRGKMDSDPHFWMPFTLAADTYRDAMAAKGDDPDVATRHHARMQALLARVLQRGPDRGVLGAVRVGADTHWWDYGALSGYYRSNMLLTHESAEAEAMRLFLGVRRGTPAAHSDGIDIDSDSVLINCSIRSGTIRRSVLVGVQADTVHADRSVAVNSAAARLTMSGALCYNVADPGTVDIGSGHVRADAFLPPDRHLAFTTSLERDGKDDWANAIDDNPMSYAELHELNQMVAPNEAEAMAEQFRRACVPQVGSTAADGE